MKISEQAKDYETYLRAKFQIEILIFRFFTRADIPAKGHCAAQEQDQHNSF